MQKNVLTFQKNTANIDTKDTDRLIDGQRLTIDILTVQPCRINPRKTYGLNYQELYDSLKSSIRNIGLQTTLTITQFPQSEHYELCNGGNTRLKILNELYHEYQAQGDIAKADSFRYQDVKYAEFTNVLDILVKHMAENEERISMSFIDKARAVFQIKELCKEENNNQDLSNRQLAEYINQLGWTGVKHQAMTELCFAFEKLDCVIPLALNSGMGRPSIRRLRLWLNEVKRYIVWLNDNHKYQIAIDDIERLYFTVLTKFDDDIEPINLDDFYQSFIFQLSEQLQPLDKQLSVESISFALSSLAEFGTVPNTSTKPQDSTDVVKKDTPTAPDEASQTTSVKSGITDATHSKKDLSTHTGISDATPIAVSSNEAINDTPVTTPPMVENAPISQSHSGEASVNNTASNNTIIADTYHTIIQSVQQHLSSCDMQQKVTVLKKLQQYCTKSIKELDNNGV